VGTEPPLVHPLSRLESSDFRAHGVAGNSKQLYVLRNVSIVALLRAFYAMKPPSMQRVAQVTDDRHVNRQATYTKSPMTTEKPPGEASMYCLSAMCFYSSLFQL